jgi:hypothetical protein
LIALFFIPCCGLLHAQTLSPVPPLSFVKPFAGADPLPQTVTVTSAGKAVGFSVDGVADTGGNWLSVTVVGLNCCATPRPITAIVTTTTAMAVGTYSGHITITASIGTLVVPVTLRVEPVTGTFFDNLPGQVSFGLQTGGTAVTSQKTQIRNGGTGNLNWALRRNS